MLDSDASRRSAFNDLKLAPKRPSVSHLDALVRHVRWLESLGDKAGVLEGLLPAKVRHFAAEAQSLDAAELKDVNPPKRYTLLLSLISQTQVHSRDDLSEMFCKRMARIQTRAQETLARIRKQHRQTTEALIDAFADVLGVLDRDPTDAEVGPLIRRAVAQHGDVPELLAGCEAIAAYNGDNSYRSCGVSIAAIGGRSSVWRARSASPVAPMTRPSWTPSECYWPMKIGLATCCH